MVKKTVKNRADSVGLTLYVLYLLSYLYETFFNHLNFFFMKKFYAVLTFAFFATFSFAQNAAITGCLDEANESITIEFDNSMNCSAAPGSLAGLNEIGFHSGANMWAAVVAWDAGTNAVNNGSDVFSVTVTPGDYYGVALADLENIYFVFNQGPETPDSPWDSEGKDEGDGGCSDFFVTVADLAACVSSTVDVALANSLTVKPNPFSEFAVINFDNPNFKQYDVTVTTLTGQVVRTFAGVSGNTIEISRDNLTAGMYFINFVSEEGKVATTKVIVQ